jgi:putative ABC transport system permease protein
VYSGLARALGLAPAILGEALAQLRAGGREQWLTLLGLVWGASAVILLLSFGAGFHRLMDLGFKKTGDRYVMAFGQFTSQELGGARPGRKIVLDREDLARVRAGAPRARAGWGVAARRVPARTPLRTRTTLVAATTAEIAGIEVHRVARGRFLDADDDRLGRSVAVLGGNLAAEFFGEADPIGRSIQLDGKAFDVVGVLARKGQQFVTNEGLHDDTVFVPLSRGQKLFGMGDAIGVLIADPFRAEDGERLVAELRAILFARHRIPESDPDAISLLEIQQFVRPMLLVGSALRVLLGAIGTGILAIAGAGVANLMVASVNRRRPELATRRACGARRGDVILQIVAETLVVVLAGGALGAGLGVAALLGIAMLPLPELVPAPRLEWNVVATAFALLAGIGLIAGVTPARVASRVDPAAALRAL